MARQASTQENAGDQRPVGLAAINDPREHEADHQSALVEGVPLSAETKSGFRPSEATVCAAANAVALGGRALAANEKAYFEPRYGGDLSQVRIHNDDKADMASNAVGARAFCVGNHMAFGRGEFDLSSREGRALIGHELAHVAQTRGTVSTLFRKEKKKAPTVEESETAFGTLLRGPAFSAGMTLAFYDENEPEAKRRADDFAGREKAIGFTGKRPTAHNLEAGKAISGIFEVDTTVNAITSLAKSALARMPAASNLPAESAAAPAKVRRLAIFAHGTNDWCSLGVTTGNAGKIFKAIAPNLSSNVDVILYTCSSARGAAEDENWVKGTLDPGGKGSLAEKVRDALVDEKMDAASVWGHTTVGHTSRNFALRVFDSRDGKGAAGKSYASTFVFDESDKTSAIADLITIIENLGYTFDKTDKTFQVRAAALIRERIYLGYAEANNKLEGVHPAEDAPVNPYMNASRISKYWKETYWPSNKERTAKALIKALKLKKPKKEKP